MRLPCPAFFTFGSSPTAETKINSQSATTQLLSCTKNGCAKYLRTPPCPGSDLSQGTDKPGLSMVRFSSWLSHPYDHTGGASLAVCSAHGSYFRSELPFEAVDPTLSV